MSEAIDRLRELLEGSQVLKVCKSTRRESVCELYVEKNRRKYRFTLFATDLGAWVEGEKDIDGSYRNVQDLIEETFDHFGEHDDYGSVSYESFDEPLKRFIGFKCRKCCKEFKIGLSAVKNSEYMEFFTTPKKRQQFAKLLSETYVQDKQTALDYIKELEN